MSVKDKTFRQQLNQAVAASQSLPQPDDQAIAHSQRVLDEILRRLDQASTQRLSFAEYMDLALNAPGLGYYSAGNQKFGAGGDFVTAPEISDLFADSLAHQCQQVLSRHDSSEILEIGAGSGRLALDLLRALQAMDSLPSRYCILEPSAELQQRQARVLAEQLPELQGRIQWLQALPQEFHGLIIANEVLDAMPVHRFRYNGDDFEIAYVSVDEASASLPGRQLCLRFEPAPAPLQQLLHQRCVGVANGYVGEISPAREAWTTALAASLHSGVILLIDYGYARHEYYHPQRKMGTLTCHYRHRVHADAFFYPGIQDITAFVEFTAVAEAASAAGLSVAGFATQAQFLMSCGLQQVLQRRLQAIDDSELDDGAKSMAQARLSQEMKQLVLPSEMGESFKVLALSKEFDESLLGFSQFDLRHKL